MNLPHPVQRTAPRARWPVVPAAVVLAVTALGGCAGYQIGNQMLYRPDIRTVHVPIFQSDSFRRNLGEMLTEAVVKRIESTTPYKVVDAASADSVLTGRLLPDHKRVIAENTNDEPRDIELDMVVHVSWIDRRGTMIGQQAAYPLPPVLIGIRQNTHLVPEAGQSIATARQQAVQRLAEQIVGQMEMPW